MVMNEFAETRREGEEEGGRTEIEVQTNDALASM
jgi:hypothetical protein